MKVARWLVPAAVLSLVVTGVPVHAADPASGTISRERRTVRWSGGPFYAPRPVGCHVPSALLSNDPTCDSFFVRANLRDGAKIRVRLAATRPAKPCCEGPAPVGGDDYDIYVWNRHGTIIAESNRANEGVETLVFEHDAEQANHAYEIEVIPFMVAPGSTYTASAQAISLGD